MGVAYITWVVVKHVIRLWQLFLHLHCSVVKVATNLSAILETITFDLLVVGTLV